MTDVDESDEQCMLGLRQGREDQLQVLMDRYQHLLVNHFRKRGVHEEYEDLAQETFFRIYKARKRYRPTAAFKTWMFTVAERVWIDYVRKSARKDRRERAYREEPRPQTASAEIPVSGDLLWALDQLPRGQRDVVVLSFYDGLSHREISEILDIPEGTVKSRKHHALEHLQSLFREQPHAGI